MPDKFLKEEVAHDYNKAYESVIRTARDFEWDAMVVNMVWVWTGLAQAMGLKYYGSPWPAIIGDPKVVTDVWAQTDGLAYMFAWQMLESF